MDTGYYQSPIGGLQIAADDSYIISISFKEGKKKSINPLIKLCEEQLDAYFNNDLQTFDIPFKLTGTDFQKKVWKELTEIPFGKTISYTELAIRLGDLKSIRAAGTANGKNKLPIIVPCHRVIGKDGSLVGFAGGLYRKKWLLKHEGVIRGEQIEIFG